MRYSHYKPTGSPWLPEIPEGWGCALVGHCYNIQLGKMLCGSQPDKSYTLEPYYCAANVHFDGVQHVDLKRMWYCDEEKDCYRVRNGDLLIVEGGAGAGGSAIVKHQIEETYMQNSVLRLRPRENADNDFLCFWFESIVKRGYVEVTCNKATIPHFTKEKISRVPFPLPPLSIQRAIVAFLDEKCGKVNRLVAAKEKEVALLKELKQAMIAEAVTGGIRVNRHLVASDIPWLPEVPEGWECGKVRQYFRLRVTKVSEKDYPPLSVAKVGVVPQLSDVAISMAEGDTRKLVKEGDYVVNSRSDRKGSCGIAPRDGSVTTISIVLEPHDIERKYVHYLFRSTPWVEEFYRNGRGIVADLWTTNFNQMRNMMLPIPPLAEQREIVAHIEARAAKIDAAVVGLEKEIAALKEYKQRLIADVVTGQRRVA